VILRNSLVKKEEKRKKRRKEKNDVIKTTNDLCPVFTNEISSNGQFGSPGHG